MLRAPPSCPGYRGRIAQRAPGTAAELSSLSRGLEELTDRLGQLAASLSGPAGEGLGSELYEVERALSAAARRLSRAAREAGGG